MEIQITWSASTSVGIKAYSTLSQNGNDVSERSLAAAKTFSALSLSGDRSTPRYFILTRFINGNRNQQPLITEKID
jgi:hypothetical protein